MEVKFENKLLTDAEKIKLSGSLEKYYENAIDQIIDEYCPSTWSIYQSELSKNSYKYKQRMCDLYYGEYDIKDYNYLNLNLGNIGDFPTKIENYNIIKPIIDVLAGDEIGRVTSFNVFAIDGDSIDNKNEDQAKAIYKKELAQIFTEWSKNSIEISPDIITQLNKEYEIFLSMGGKSEIEILAGEALAYLVQHTEFKKKMTKGFYDYMLMDEEIYYIYKEGENVNFRVCDPRYTYHNIPFTSDSISDCEFVVEKRNLTLAEIMEEYYEYIDKDKIEWLNGKSGNNTSQNRFGLNATPESIIEINDRRNEGLYNFNNINNSISVYNVSWINKREIYITEKGDIYFNKNEIKGEKTNIKKKFIDEAWIGTRIGEKKDAIYINIKPQDVQFRNIDNLGKCKLAYRGITYFNRNKTINSIVALCEKYQELYNEIMYRIKIELATSKGKITFIDKSMIPSNSKDGDGGYANENDVATFLYNMAVHRIGFYDSSQMEEFGNQTPYESIKAINVVDLTPSQSINLYIEMLNMIIAQIEQMTGVNKPRQGQTKATQTATGINSDMTQSAIITEYIFNRHSYCKTELLTGMLDMAKEVWKESKKTQIYIGDGNSKILNIIPEKMQLHDFAVFIDSDNKHRGIEQMMMQLVQTAISTGQIMLGDVIDILNEETIASKKKKMQASQEKMAERNKQIEQMKSEMEQKIQQMEMEKERMKINAEIEMNKLDNKTKIDIVNLQLDQDNLLNANSIVSDKEKIKLEKKNNASAEVDRELNNSIDNKLNPRNVLDNAKILKELLNPQGNKNQ